MGGDTRGVNGGARQTISLAASRVRVDLAFAAIDLVVVVAAYSIGLGLRMLDTGVTEPAEYWSDLLLALTVIIAIHLTTNALAGAYGHVWEHASISEAVRLTVASGTASAIIVGGTLLLREPLGLRISIGALAIGGLLSFLMMGLVRYRSRLFSHRRRLDGPRTVVVGSSKDAVGFARRAHEIDGAGSVVGFVTNSDELLLRQRLLADHPVLGRIEDLAEMVSIHDLDQVVVVDSDPALVKSVVDACIDVDVRLRILPGIEEAMNGATPLVDVRDIQVEDLLPREKVATDLGDVAGLIKGRTVVVTGGGGSIGSELVRQIANYEPERIWALDRDETLLHDASLTWAECVSPVLGDIRDAEAMIRFFERTQPALVFHAAALKHVPVLENYPEEAVMTNVVGTRNIIEAGSRVKVERFVLISTDKAVDPTSVMGATKRVAELLVKAGNSRNDGCVYTAVRFGNVLGSRGSVIPTFVSQIRQGGPVTVTDKEMTRYFMTVDEAVQLVLQASALSRGSEIFLLDMGEPVKIEDLARRLIRLAGLTPDVDIEIAYTGIRPGEKLCEELANGPVETTPNPKIFEVPLSHPGGATLADAVSALEAAAREGDTETLTGLLGRLAEGNLKARGALIDDRSPASLTWN